MLTCLNPTISEFSQGCVLELNEVVIFIWAIFEIPDNCGQDHPNGPNYRLQKREDIPETNLCQAERGVPVWAFPLTQGEAWPCRVWSMRSMRSMTSMMGMRSMLILLV